MSSSSSSWEVPKAEECRSTMDCKGPVNQVEKCTSQSGDDVATKIASSVWQKIQEIEETPNYGSLAMFQPRYQ